MQLLVRLSYLAAMALAVVLLSAAAASAQWIESGDAGSGWTTAQTVTGTGPLASIAGTLNDSTGDNYDAYRIWLDTSTSPFALTSLPAAWSTGTNAYILDNTGAQKAIGWYGSSPSLLTYAPTYSGVHYLRLFMPFGTQPNGSYQANLQNAYRADGPALPPSGTPEPSTMALLGFGLVLAARRRRSAKRG